MKLCLILQYTAVALASPMRVLAATAGSATAGKAAPLSTFTSTPDPTAMGSLWQMSLGLLLVLALIVAIAWVLKRSGSFQLAAGGGLRVLGGLSMGSRERVVLIQAGDTQLLLGVAPGRVQTLHVLDKPLQTNQPVAGAFSEQLSRLLHRDKTS
jgi:flagellar protein FliO/FliZ